MVHVEKIKIIGKTYPSAEVLKLNFEITCASVNLFVGNQGCGKSTLLNLLRTQHKDLELKLSDYCLKNSVDSFYFDSEKHNPRINDLNAYTTPTGENTGYGIGNALKSHFRSHGEVLQELIIEPLLKAKNCVILLDEPESGLSITNQFTLINAIERAVSNNCQLFIATHCYPLIEHYDVISLEHNRQMKGIDFIKKVKKQVKVL